MKHSLLGKYWIVIHSTLLEKCVVSSAKCVVVEGAHKIWKRPNTLFYFTVQEIAYKPVHFLLLIVGFTCRGLW